MGQRSYELNNLARAAGTLSTMRYMICADRGVIKRGHGICSSESPITLNEQPNLANIG